MANNIHSVDVNTGKIYKHSGFSNTILNSFTSPGAGPSDICFDGTNVFSTDTSTDKIYKHDGFSASLLDSFSSPDAFPQALTILASDIYSSDNSTGGKIWKHTGFSSSITDSFSSPSTDSRGITHDGTNLYSCDANTDKIYKHNGFSNTILDSFSSPSTTPTGITWDGTNLYSVDSTTDKIYKHSGFSVTITDSFSSPSTNPTGIEWENYGARTGEVTVTPSVLTITSSTLEVVFNVTAELSALTLASSALTATFDSSTIVSVSALTLASAILAPSLVLDVAFSVSTITLASATSSVTVIVPQVASYALKIISYNPLIFISDNPLSITRVYTTSPENPTWQVQALSGISSPTSVSVDTGNGWIYLAGADGKILKIDIDDLSSYSTLDVTDASDFIAMGSYGNQYLAYGATNEVTGEAYIIDSRVDTTITTNFQVVVQLVGTIDTYFSTVESLTGGALISADFKVLSETETLIATNLTVLPSAYSSITPMGRTDWHLYIDNVEVRVDDLDLTSIHIRHVIGDESEATFNLARRHDKPNYNFNGDTSTITNQNGIKIYFGSTLEFSGKVAEIDAIYDKGNEQVKVTAYATQPTEKYNSVLLPLPGLTENRSIYHVIMQNPKIYNPYIDPTSTNPKKYLGIRVTLGKKITESLYQAKAFTDTAALASDIIDGTFKPKQNYTYFWMVRARKIKQPTITSTVALTPTQEFEKAYAEAFAFNPYGPFSDNSVSISTFIRQQQTLFQLFNKSVQAEFQTAYITDANLGIISNLSSTELGFLHYVGTSLGGLTSDLWQLINATWWQQREYTSIEYKLGDGTITVAELEDEFPTKGDLVFNAIRGGGYIDGSGNITEAFKTCQSASDFSINYGRATADRVYAMLEDKLGYTVGSAPYKSVSARNGIYIPKERWVDEADGLYAEKNEAYNYLDFAKKVADLEYKKIKNINDSILPITSISLNLTLDAYYFYGLKLLTRINIDNTTEVNVYNGNNGFPVSVKSIELDSSTMQVSINADNQKSSVELTAIDGEFPDEDSTDYYQKGYKTRIFTKYDLQSETVTS